MLNTRRLVIILIYSLLLLSSYGASADLLKIGFISTGTPEAERVNELIIKELSPLVKNTTQVEFVNFIAAPSPASFQQQVTQANSDPDIKAIIATDVLGSQYLYEHEFFAKPTFLSWVINPSLMGIESKNNTQNLYWLSTKNDIKFSLQAIYNVIGQQPITLVADKAVAQLGESFFQRIKNTAAEFGIQFSVTLLDQSKPIRAQIAPDIAMALVPPMKNDTTQLIEQLQAINIPVFSLEGVNAVKSGAMMTDVVSANELLIARQIALDIYSLFQQESLALGVRWLDAEHHLTFNIMAAQRMGIDLPINAITSATAVGMVNLDIESISLQNILQWALAKNPNLAQANNNIALAEESIIQAKSSLLPQLNGSLNHTRHNNSGSHVATGSPHHNSQAAIDFSQIIYSKVHNINYQLTKLNKQSQQQTEQASQQSTVIDALNLFLQVLILEASLEAQQENVLLARSNLLMAKKRAKLGSGAKSDVYNLESAIATANANLLAAHIGVLEAKRSLMDITSTEFNIYAAFNDIDLNHPNIASSHQLIKPFLETLGGIQKLATWSAQQATNNSPTLKASSLIMASNRLRREAAQKEIYAPKVTLTGQAYRFLNSSTGSSGTNLKGVDDANISINMTLPLWTSGQNTSLVRQANQELISSELAHLGRQNSIQVAARNSAFKLAQAWQNIQLGKIALESAEKSLQITQQAYISGALTIDALQSLQNTYIAALSADKSNLYKYIQALGQWQLQIGTVNYLMSPDTIEQWSLKAQQQLSQPSLPYDN